MMDWLALWGSLAGILLGIAGMIHGWRSLPRFPKGSWSTTKGRIISCSRSQLVIEFDSPEGRKSVSVSIYPPFQMAAMPEEFHLGADLLIQCHTTMPSEGLLITEKLPEYAQQWLKKGDWTWTQNDLDWYIMPVSTAIQIGSGILLVLSILGLAVALHHLL